MKILSIAMCLCLSMFSSSSAMADESDAPTLEALDAYYPIFSGVCAAPDADYGTYFRFEDWFDCRFVCRMDIPNFTTRGMLLCTEIASDPEWPYFSMHQPYLAELGLTP